MFLHLYIQDGLKSSNMRICIKSIEILNDLLAKTHHHENISPILEILLQYLQDPKFRANYNRILLRAIQHLKRILNSELFNTYLDSFSPSLKRLYHTYVAEQIDNNLDSDKNDEDDDEKTPRASLQVSQLKDSTNKTNHLHTGTIFRSKLK